MEEITPKYTEEIHAEGLLEVLSQDNPCGECPAGHAGYLCYNHIENICRGFVGLSKKSGNSSCPCHSLHKSEAIKRTWLALEEKGYI